MSQIKTKKPIIQVNIKQTLCDSNGQVTPLSFIEKHTVVGVRYREFLTLANAYTPRVPTIF